MSRGGRDKSRGQPERRCIVTGEVQPKPGLIRFVVGPDNIIVPDLAEKLPGRGIWVAADPAALEKAATKGLFSRAAKAQVKAPEDLAGLVETALARRVVELVSLARKSGNAVAGFEKVKGWLADGRAKVLLQASDGSERGKGKLWTPTGGRWFGCLTASEFCINESTKIAGGFNSSLKDFRFPADCNGKRHALKQRHGGRNAARRENSWNATSSCQSMAAMSGPR